MIYTSFENPEFGKTVEIRGEQHYAACKWRGKTWVLTDVARTTRLFTCALLVSEDGYGVFCDAQGNFANDPVKILETHFNKIVGRKSSALEIR